MKELLLKNMELLEDLSNLKKKVNRLEEAETTKLRAILDNLSFGIALIDEDGNFTYINPKFKDMFGYELRDIPNGRTWFRKAYPNDTYRHNVIATWKEDLEVFKENHVTGERKSWTFTVTCKDGDKKIINFIPVMLVTGEHLLTCEDVTEKTNLETQLRQAQKAEAIGTLAGGIAHDFNNILTALMGYATLLKDKMDKQNPLQRYVDLILSASQKATDLTRGLLAFSRKQPLNLTPLNVNSAIKETKKLLKRILTEDIEFSVSLTKDDAVVMADRSQIDQILFNLVTNARDAMPNGGELSIKTSITVLDNNFAEKHGFGKSCRYVLISISDTGIGMDEETKEKIFDPFFTTKEVGKGTGLGLATVYAIVKKHNGYITVDSKPNKGTTFNIYLPSIDVIVENKEGTIKTPMKGQETILVAEDNYEVRCLIREILEQSGYRAIEAIDGEDAIDKFKKNNDVKLVIIDSVMPKKNGHKVYEEIKKIRPHIKTLFISGHTKDVILKKGIESRKFNFIAKPLKVNDFLVKVREVLDGSL